MLNNSSDTTNNQEFNDKKKGSVNKNKKVKLNQSTFKSSSVSVESHTDVDQSNSHNQSTSDKISPTYQNNNPDLIDKQFSLAKFKQMSVTEIMSLAETLGISYPSNANRNDLTVFTLKKCADRGAIIIGEGVLEVVNDSYGFLRSSRSNYKSSSDDIYVSPAKIKKLGLRSGDTISGEIKSPRRDERYFALSNVRSINLKSISESKQRVFFEDLTPLYPQERIKLESDKTQLSSRIIDIISPLGKGQRALIVAPPRTGKTVLMQKIAHSITTNYPDLYLIVLSIGERPEEVTDMIRSVKGEVVSSTFDESPQRHVSLAELVIEKSRRLVENKKDVVVLLDSITRLARAYNDIAPSSGRVLSGGVDSNALQRPKKFFGAARNIEEGGSLTIIATSLIETGSRMDEVIFEEFKGTGNSEIVLDRKISDKRVFPAIDITKSGTRKEELLVDSDNLSKSWILRKITNQMSSCEAAEFLISKLKFYDSNSDFFDQMNAAKSFK